MKKIIVVILLLTAINSNAAEVKKENNNVLTKNERMELENYMLKVRELNYQINLAVEKRAEYAKNYEAYYDFIMKKYNRKKDDWAVNLETGEFVKQEKKTTK